MARGIIYLMTTLLEGIVKYGKATPENFEERMRFLEHNGYHNMTGLKRHFAIEVDNFDEVEKLLIEINHTHQIDNSELFKLHKEEAKKSLQMCILCGGKQIFPKIEETAISTSSNIKKEDATVSSPIPKQVSPTSKMKSLHTKAYGNTKNSPFTFFMLGIPVGAELKFRDNPTITCTVKDNRRVVYDGKTYYLSPLARELRYEKDKDTRNVWTYRGPDFFLYNGKPLTDIYNEVFSITKKQT